jgi:hypothetical protein
MIPKRVYELNYKKPSPTALGYVSVQAVPIACYVRCPDSCRTKIGDQILRCYSTQLSNLLSNITVLTTLC